MWYFVSLSVSNGLHSGFSQTHKIGKIGIIVNFTFPYICSFLLNLQYMMLVNMKLDISGCNRITFQGNWIHWSGSFLIAWLNEIGNNNNNNNRLFLFCYIKNISTNHSFLNNITEKGRSLDHPILAFLYCGEFVKNPNVWENVVVSVNIYI